MYNPIKRIVMMCLTVACLILPVQVHAADSGAGTLLDSDRTVIAPGFVSYARSYGEHDEMRQKTVSVELSQDSDVYPIVMACDTIWGGLSMDAIIGYAENQGYTVVGAVNTAFYKTPGVPIGIVVENGLLRSSDDGMNAMAILEDGSYYAVKNPQMSITLHNETWGTEWIAVDQFNNLFYSSQLHLYSSAYSTVSTRLEEDDLAWAVRLRIEEGEMKLRGSVRLTVTEVLTDVQAVPIGEEYMVLTAAMDGPYGGLWQGFAVGDTVMVQTDCADEKLVQAKYITGCGDLLVENGAIADSADWMHNIGGPNPRTLVGWRADGTLVLYVAEGRNPGIAEGLTLRMAAEEMLRQGCEFAVNMDGGGSSIVGVRIPGQRTVMPLNLPSDGGQRPCAAYLLLVTDQASDTVARNWHLEQNHRMVLPNQQMRLSAFATDGALLPTQSDLPLTFADEAGLLESDLYTAPETGGTHPIYIWGGDGYGEGEIKVIANPSVLRIVDRFGRMPRAVTLEQGETLDVRILASHHGKVIPADNTMIQYEMTAPLGTVDADGVFTADALVGTRGTLTMRVGRYTQQLQVTVVSSRTDVSRLRMKTALDDLQGIG